MFDQVSDRKFQNILLAPIIVLLGYLFYVAYHFTIDYYDSILILLNARCVATANVEGYSGSRPIILPIVLSYVYFLKPLASDPRNVFIVSHITMIFFFIGLLFFSFRTFQFYLSQKMSLFVIFLMCTNRALIHAAPYCKEDVFAVFLMTAAFYFYLKANLKGFRRHFLFSGLLISLAIGARYNYPLILPIIALYELMSRQSRFTRSPKKLFLEGKDSKLKVLLLILLPVALFALIVSWHYSSIKLAPFKIGFYKYLTEPIPYMMQIVRDITSLPAYFNVVFLAKATSWPFLLLGVAGMLSALSKRERGSLFFFLWFIVFFTYHTFFAGQKEARFSISFFPPLYYFIALGFREAWDAVKKIPWDKWRIESKAVQALLFILVLFVPIKQTIAECVQFQDPIYRVNFAKEVSDYAQNLLSPGRRICWAGAFYTVYPKKYIFHIEEVTYYMHHFYLSFPAFYTGKVISLLQNAQFIPPKKEGEPLFIGPYAQNILEDGDVLIAHREPEGYNTKRLPANGVGPLWVERVRKWRFTSSSISDGNVSIFKNAEFPNSEIRTSLKNEGLVIEGKKFPDGVYEVYLELVNPDVILSMTITGADGGDFYNSNAAFHELPNIKSIIVFTFDSVREFTNPR